MKGLRAALAAGALTLLAFLADPSVWGTIRYPGVDQHDWGRLFRVAGSLVFWAPVALAIGLQLRGSGRPGWNPGWRVMLAPVVAGGLAELIKLLVRRERPNLHDGLYVFRSFAERPLDSHDLGFPSSHAAVACAGAAVLARLYPRAGMIAWGLAAGCMVTRVLAQAHFVSDVVAGGILGWAVGGWIARGESA